MTLASTHFPHVDLFYYCLLFSEDVIHSMYEPAFRLKHEVLPGSYGQLSFEVNRLGENHLFCAVYRGTEHSKMIGRWGDGTERPSEPGWPAACRTNRRQTPAKFCKRCAFKIMLGRAFKWMPRAKGERREAEAVRLIRKHAGHNELLRVGANKGYDPAGAKRLLDQLGEEPLASQKNCSPITVEECLDLKAMIKSLTGNSARPSGPSFREHILWLSCLYRFAVRPACSKRMLFLFLLSLASWQDRVFHGDERQ